MNSQRINNYLEFTEVLNRVARSSNLVTISRIRGPLTEAIIRQAFELAQRRHPCLNYRVIDTSGSLSLKTEEVPNIPLRIVRDSHSNQWQNIASEEANKKIDTSQAFLKAALFYPDDETSVSYLITTVHHGITDALSNIQLHRDILTYCQNIASGKSIEVSSLPVLPPIEDLLPESAKGFRGNLNKLLFVLRFGLKQLRYRPITLKSEKSLPPLELCRSSFVHRQLDEKLTQDLVNSCKHEKVSTHSALCAAMMFSVARKIEYDTKKSVSMSCCTTISLRKSLDPIISKEHIGMLSSCVMSYQTLRPNTSFWELAREIKQQFQYGLMSSDPFVQLLMTSKKMAERFIKNPNQVMSFAVLAGSLQADIPESYGDFELEEINMTSAAAVHGAAFCGAAITFRRKLSLNFFYSESSISQDTMDFLADNVIFYLSKACKRKLELTLV